MRIDEKTIFTFGKYEGKSFTDVIISDIDYLRFLYRKGFKFSQKCVHFILDGFDNIKEINHVIVEKKDLIRFYSVDKIVCRAAKGKRKNDLVLIHSRSLINHISIKNVPFEIIEKEVIRNCFDSKAFQNDDRFFTVKEKKATKVYDKVILNNIIDEILTNYQSPTTNQ
ncbi:exodeoxyribonuclease X C-terminal domain-containing protein [Elizabethkingia anophelis]|uniref:exodeoxyribonuclease X C-terminal domain-containing protein n=1 Tax=Elizabethkingia anophelis TaxID=1117645 RepID=UPI0038921946